MPAAFRRLSESPLWSAQRRYYERAGIEAWRTATVPHHVTNNVALATAYARVVLGFLDDVRQLTRLDVVELGAGSGRFGFLFLQALDRLAPDAARRVRYVMTDVAERTIAFWRHHPALRPFVRAGRLDFARFDADRDAAIRLVHARRTIAPGAPVPSMIIIASYVFSGLHHDAFVAGTDGLREYLVTMQHRDAGHPADMPLAWRIGAPVAAPYREPHLSRIAAVTTRRRPSQPVAFPIGALRCLDRLTLLARDALLVLVADRGRAATDRAGSIGLGLGRHGAVSFPLNFPALRGWAGVRKGTSLRPPRRPRHLHVEAIVLGDASSTWPRSRAAWRRTMGAGGPDALYAERRRLSATAAPSTPRALVSVMRRSGADPRLIAECLRPLWPHLADPAAALRRALTSIVRAGWRSYFHIGEPHDLPFDFGLVLYQVRAYTDARTMFLESLRLHGDHAATRWNLGLCQVALGNPRAAMAAFARAHRLAPALRPVGLATAK